MFITDRYLETEGLYSESGRSFLFECDDSNNDDITEKIKAQAALRTGRADDVGASQYMNELGERQKNENQH